jgi:hypothetical protein
VIVRHCSERNLLKEPLLTALDCCSDANTQRKKTNAYKQETIETGLLLWNIFRNDMTFEVKTASLSIYADDHQLYVKGETTECVKKIFNKEGHKISQWYKDNFLKGNYDKYSLMLLGRKK